MAFITAWLIVGVISFVGLFAEHVEDGDFVRSDVWGIPSAFLLLVVVGPLPYIVRCVFDLKNKGG